MSGAVVELEPDWPAEGEIGEIHVSAGHVRAILVFEDQIADFLRRGHRLRITFENATEAEFFRFWIAGGRPS